MKCKNCGAPLSGNVCEYCGSVFENNEAPKDDKSKTQTFVTQKKTCPHCKSLVDKEAKVCSHCGKKLPQSSAFVGCLIILAFIVLVFYIISSIIGAIASSFDDNKPTQQIVIEYGNGTSSSMIEQSNDTASQVIQEIGKAAELDYGKVSITEVKQTTKGVSSFYTPQKGKAYVAVSFLVENDSDEERYFSSGNITAYLNDIKQQNSSMAYLALYPNTNGRGGNIAAGKKAQVIYGLEIDENWESIEFVIDSWDFSENDEAVSFIVKNNK